MTWQPYESQGVVAIDMVLADRIATYLEKKESELSFKIVESIHLVHELPPTLPPGPSTLLRLHEAVESFGKKVRRVTKLNSRVVPQDEWEICAKLIQEAIWQYVEHLEGSLTELFQQLDQIGFEHWNTQLSRAMSAIKDSFLHQMDDLIWTIRRLEEQLREFRNLSLSLRGKNRLLTRIIPPWKKLLDPSLEKAVGKCQKFLGFNYQAFTEDFAGYAELYQSTEKSLKQINHYRVLLSLDLDVQERIKKVYQLLKLWGYNQTAKVLPQGEIERALQGFLTSDQVLSLFNKYISQVKKGLFDKSRMIKKQFREVFHDIQARRPLIDNTSEYRIELKTLTEMLNHYKAFLATTSSLANGKKQGLFQWLRNSKANEVDPIKSLLFDIEQLDVLCAAFQSSMESDQAMDKRLTCEIEGKITEELHEIGQPLMSRVLMYKHLESVLASLKHLDELATSDPTVVDYVSAILCKAMRADWKYNVLQEIPLFHQLYEIHLGVVQPLENRQHVSRLKKFHKLTVKLSRWIECHEAVAHHHEIELDINDIKAYLQDFFASVQSLKQEVNQESGREQIEDIKKTNQALLEYRYLFGKFFHQLRTDVPEEQCLRRQLLFVDQYFEAIENRVQEMAFK